ncbi:MAG: MFS transporter [Phycisphaeraceae bacterium]|nr:MFS transporter [Phycisphaeraceae bacterium]
MSDPAAESKTSATTDDPAETEEDNGDAISPIIGEGRVAGGIGPGALPRFARWPKALRAFRHSDYRLLWAGAFVSNVGSWMQNVAQAWLIYDLTQSATWLGIDAFASGLPVVALLPLGGVMADRLNRRWLLIWSNLVSALMAATLAVMAATDFLTAQRVWWIVALSVGTGLSDAIRVPATQSLVPVLVGRDDLVNAMSLNSIQFNISRALGPALAGVSLVSLGVSWSFTFNAASFLAVIAAVAMMRNVPAALPGRESVGESLRGGVRYLRSRPDLMMMMVLIAMGGFLFAPITGKMLPVVAQEIFHLGAVGYSQLVSAFGLGAVLGAAAMALQSHKKPNPWRAVPLYVLLGVCELALCWHGPFALAAGIVALGGAVFVAAVIQINTTILHSSPDEVRGRVASFQVLSFRLGMPLGNLTAGLLATSMGIRSVLFGFGVAMIVLAPAAMMGYRRRAGEETRRQGDTETRRSLS